MATSLAARPARPVPWGAIVGAMAYYFAYLFEVSSGRGIPGGILVETGPEWQVRNSVWIAQA